MSTSATSSDDEASRYSDDNDSADALLRAEVAFFVKKVERAARDSITRWARLVEKYKDTHSEDDIRSLLPQPVSLFLDALSFEPEHQQPGQASSNPSPPSETQTQAAPVTADARRFRASCCFFWVMTVDDFAIAFDGAATRDVCWRLEQLSKKVNRDDAVRLVRAARDNRCDYNWRRAHPQMYKGVNANKSIIPHDVMSAMVASGHWTPDQLSRKKNKNKRHGNESTEVEVQQHDEGGDVLEEEEEGRERESSLEQEAGEGGYLQDGSDAEDTQEKRAPEIGRRATRYASNSPSLLQSNSDASIQRDDDSEDEETQNPNDQTGEGNAAAGDVSSSFQMDSPHTDGDNSGPSVTPAVGTLKRKNAADYADIALDPSPSHNKRAKVAQDDIAAAAVDEPGHHKAPFDGPDYGHKDSLTPSSLRPRKDPQTMNVVAASLRDGGSAGVNILDFSTDFHEDRHHRSHNQEEPRLSRLLGLGPISAASSTEQALVSLETPEAWVNDVVMDASLALLSTITGGLRVRYVSALWTKRALDEAMTMAKEMRAATGTGGKTDIETPSPTSSVPSQMNNSFPNPGKTSTSRRIRTWLFLDDEAQRSGDTSGPSRAAALAKASPVSSSWCFPLTSLVFQPVNVNGNHWILVIVRPARRLVELYDPLAHQSGSLQTLVVQYITAMGLAHVLDWGPIRILAGPEQPNTHDCGIYVIATAFLITGGANLPKELAGDLWRRVVARLLRAAMVLDERDGHGSPPHAPAEPAGGSKPSHDGLAKHTSGSASSTPAPKPLLPLSDPTGALSGPVSFPMPDYFIAPSPGTLVSSSYIDQARRQLVAMEAAVEKATHQRNHDRQARVSTVTDVTRVLQDLSGRSHKALVWRKQQLATLPSKIANCRSARQALIDADILRPGSRQVTNTTEASLSHAREVAADEAGGVGGGNGSYSGILITSDDDPASAAVTARIGLLEEQLAVLQHGFLIDADLGSGFDPSKHIAHPPCASCCSSIGGGDAEAGFVGTTSTTTTPLGGLLRRLGLATVPRAAVSSNDLAGDDDYEPYAHQGTNGRARRTTRLRYRVPKVDEVEVAVDAVRRVEGDLGRELEVLRP